MSITETIEAMELGVDHLLELYRRLRDVEGMGKEEALIRLHTSIYSTPDQLVKDSLLAMAIHKLYDQDACPTCGSLYPKAWVSSSPDLPPCSDPFHSKEPA